MYDGRACRTELSEMYTELLNASRSSSEWQGLLMFPKLFELSRKTSGI